MNTPSNWYRIANTPGLSEKHARVWREVHNRNLIYGNAPLGPSDLAAPLGYTASAVRKRLYALEKAGWLHRERRQDADRAPTLSRYVCTLPHRHRPSGGPSSIDRLMRQVPRGRRGDA